MQDIGRVGVSSAIWAKPGKLSDTEWERVRLHPYFTERVFSKSAALVRWGALAASHHERMDGSGYHRHVPGTMLSKPSRLLAAADVFCAMTEPPTNCAARASPDGSMSSAWTVCWLRQGIRPGIPKPL